MKVTNAMKAASRTTSIPVNAVVDFEKEGRSETHDRAPINQCRRSARNEANSIDGITPASSAANVT